MTEDREPYADELPELFTELLGLAPAAAAELLARIREQRPALAARLEELLAADRDAGAFLERPFSAPGVSATLAPGDVVEGFRIEANLASGANGSVYRALQDFPRRTVALKLLHFALPSAGAIARFRQEVRTLARLAHPGIVPLYAAGVIEPETRALPWFAMELIEGARDIRSWARDQPIDRRVAAIAEVCDAVHHAHLKQVVHRDLKPGNILVGADGRPRVIDFGVATSAGSAASLATHIGSLTPEGAVIGTLAYMSPEQLESSSDVDARADIYALGVILYELCTGRLPYQLGKTPAQAMRAIAVEVPIDPVRAAPGERALRGDLAAIILKAIERNPARRYGSALELQADLERWREGAPVVARRPRLAERAIRLMRRRPVASTVVVLGGSAVLGITVASIAGATMAYREAMRAQRYIHGLIAAFESPGIQNRGREARIADAADSMAAIVDTNRLTPQEAGDGRMIAGRMYEAIGLKSEAATQYTDAVEIRTAAYGPTHAETLESMAALGRSLVFVQSDAANQSRPSPETTLAVQRILRSHIDALGWEDPRTLDALRSMLRGVESGWMKELANEIVASDIAEDVRGALLLEICVRTVQRTAFTPPLDPAWTGPVGTAIERAMHREDLSCVKSAAVLVVFSAAHGETGLAQRLLDAMLPVVAERATHASLGEYMGYIGEACLMLDMPQEALILLERAQSQTSHLSRYRLYYDPRFRGGIAEALIALARPADALEVLAPAAADFEAPAASDEELEWPRLLALAMRAQALSAAGNREAAHRDRDAVIARAAVLRSRGLLLSPRIARALDALDAPVEGESR